MNSHWSEKKEKGGSLFLMRITLLLYKKLGIRCFRFFLHSITVFFYLFSPKIRKISKQYLKRINEISDNEKTADKYNVYSHVFSFSNSLIEKIGAWTGEADYKNLITATPDIDLMTTELSNGRGAIIMCSHLGNIEMLRAIATLNSGVDLPKFDIYSIIDLKVTSKFNKLMEEINPDYKVKLIDASSINAATIIHLQNVIADGNLVVIAGDRTAKNNRTKNYKINFLGEEAYFPQGAFILANLLEAPVYYMFALRQKDLDFDSAYEFYLYKTKYDYINNSKDRKIKLNNMAKEYVLYLEDLCLKHPYQWFNFFDFWENPEKSKKRGK